MTGMRVLMADNRLCEAGPQGEAGLRLCHRALEAFGFRKAEVPVISESASSVPVIVKDAFVFICRFTQSRPRG